MATPFCGLCGLKIAETRFCTETGIPHIDSGVKATSSHSISSSESGPSGTGKAVKQSAAREYIDLDAAPSSGSDLSAKILQEKKQISKKNI